MSNVELRPNDQGGYEVLVNGVDLSGVVTLDGVWVEFSKGRPVVTLRLEPMALVAVLRDAELKGEGR